MNVSEANAPVSLNKIDWRWVGVWMLMTLIVAMAVWGYTVHPTPLILFAGTSIISCFVYLKTSRPNGIGITWRVLLCAVIMTTVWWFAIRR